jgi:hypothetical protein
VLDWVKINIGNHGINLLHQLSTLLNILPKSIRRHPSNYDYHDRYDSERRIEVDHSRDTSGALTHQKNYWPGLEVGALR